MSLKPEWGHGLLATLACRPLAGRFPLVGEALVAESAT